MKSIGVGRMGNLIKVGLNYDTEIYYKLREAAQNQGLPLAVLIRCILREWVTWYDNCDKLGVNNAENQKCDLHK